MVSWSINEGGDREGETDARYVKLRQASRIRRDEEEQQREIEKI